MIKDKPYRPNVAVFIMDNNHQFLFCGRRDQRGYQLPQGGIELGESVDEALAREIKEETNIDSFEIIAKAPKTVKYKWSKDFLSDDNKYIGQEQTYFIVKIKEEEKEKINESEEFIDFKWVSIEYILVNTVDFKLKVIREAWDLLRPLV